MRLLDEEADIPPQINIVPMIDVTFSILAFFIVSSLYLTRSEGLPVNLPKAATAQVQQTTKITITLNPQGQVLLNLKPVQIEQLEAAVKQLIPPNQTATVVLNADEAVNHGRVIAVMDRLRRIPEAKLAIATQKP